MRLSVQHQFAFLCIPKCGSTSVERAIAPYCEVLIGGDPSLKHLNAKKFHRNIRPLLHKVDPRQEIEIFCIMREPMDRIRSWYQYQLRPELANPGHKRHQRYTGNVSFEQFIEAIMEKDRPTFAHIGSQAQFIKLSDGSLGVDRIFRLDHMNAVSEYLTAKIGKPIRIPFANKSVSRKKEPASLWTHVRKRLGCPAKPAVVPDLVPPPSLLDQLPAPLRSRLRDYLAEDYEIYDSIPKAATTTAADRPGK